MGRVVGIRQKIDRLMLSRPHFNYQFTIRAECARARNVSELTHNSNENGFPAPLFIDFSLGIARTLKTWNGIFEFPGDAEIPVPPEKPERWTCLAVRGLALTPF